MRVSNAKTVKDTSKRIAHWYSSIVKRANWHESFANNYTFVKCKVIPWIWQEIWYLWTVTLTIMTFITTITQMLGNKKR